MKHGIPVVMLLVLGLTLVLGFGLFAQVKKDAKTGQDRIEGTIQALDKAKSTLTLVQSSGTTKPTWHVMYNDQTKFTARNKPAKADNLKEGQRVIILGKYDQNVMTASRIDIR
jgi:hypothetical protein